MEDFYVLFDSISVITGQRDRDYEGLLAVKQHLDLDRFPSTVGLKPATLWSKIESPNHSATQMLLQLEHNVRFI